jgi:glycine/D-amino acid oxidase-like deaminating enzyme
MFQSIRACFFFNKVLERMLEVTVNAQNDIIVIGGGINGVSITYHLAQKGAKVTLIEKSFIAGGPTGVSSAIVRQHYSNVITARMAHRSLEVWSNFDQIVGGDCGFAIPALFLVFPTGCRWIKANISMQQAVGINTRFISVEEIKGLNHSPTHVV